MLIFGGVFERHPKLRIVCVEADAGWAPHWMYRMDHYYKRHHYLRARRARRGCRASTSASTSTSRSRTTGSAFRTAELHEPERAHVGQRLPAQRLDAGRGRRTCCASRPRTCAGDARPDPARQRRAPVRALTGPGAHPLFVRPGCACAAAGVVRASRNGHASRRRARAVTLAGRRSGRPGDGCVGLGDRAGMPQRLSRRRRGMEQGADQAMRHPVYEPVPQELQQEVVQRWRGIRRVQRGCRRLRRALRRRVGLRPRGCRSRRLPGGLQLLPAGGTRAVHRGRDQQWTRRPVLRRRQWSRVLRSARVHQSLLWQQPQLLLRSGDTGLERPHAGVRGPADHQASLWPVRQRVSVEHRMLRRQVRRPADRSPELWPVRQDMRHRSGLRKRRLRRGVQWRSVALQSQRAGMLQPERNVLRRRRQRVRGQLVLDTRACDALRPPARGRHHLLLGNLSSSR